MDTLSEILRSVRLKGGIFLDARFTAPWSIAAEITADDVRPYLPDPEEICGLHYILEGRLFCEVDGEPPLEVRAGELLLLPRNDEHILSHAPGQTPDRGRQLVQPGAQGGLARIHYGGGGDLTHIICGYLGNEERRTPLISTLPRMLKVNIAEGASRDWVESSVRYGAQQLTQGLLASSSVMARLSELLFVEAVRAYAQARERDDADWLQGLQDPHVGRALALMHDRLNHPWTADELAREVGVSRSVLSERFTATIGAPPMRYLTRSRMQLAKELLRQRRRSIPQIAVDVGYEAEAAFNRAFKREVGAPPAAWRDAHA
ncbi:MAG: AraC family transcriptional regulator [Rhizobiales bacterium]|nr:AraC family transcriptional regulator [Hyphomicrobiales bacterium]